MARLYYIGGEDVRKAEKVRIHSEMLRCSADCNILVFAWSAPPSENSKLWVDFFRDFFTDLGASGVQFANLESLSRRILDQISDSDLLYFPGGDPRILIDNIRTKSLVSAIQSFDGIIAGNSAGAMVMARRMIFLRGQDDEPQTSVGEGMSLSEITVSVHYDAEDRMAAGTNPDEDLFSLSNGYDSDIFAIPELSAVVVDGGTISNIGEVFIFRNGHRLEFGTV